MIELISSWAGHKVSRGGRGLRGEKANVSMCGHKLQFWSKIVAAYPDNLVRDLIAHELAHVRQAAWGWDLATADAVEAEENADAQMEWWGFDAVAIDEWDREHGVTKLITIDLNTAKGKRAFARVWDHYLRTGR